MVGNDVVIELGYPDGYILIGVEVMIIDGFTVGR